LFGPARECCGVFGVAGADDAVQRTFLGLYALQHRGEESCGIASTDGRELVCHHGMGHVNEVLTPDVLEGISNPTAIGHVRYSTTGVSTLTNAQPIVVKYAGGPIAVAHNGNLVNAAALRREYEANGSIFQTTCDSEIIVHLLADPRHMAREDCMLHSLDQLRGSFSLLLLTPDRMIVARDPNAFRPLCLGELAGTYVAASESCALTQIGANYFRDVHPGEAVFIGPDGLESATFCSEDRIRPTHCIFELIYFSRPDSYVFGQGVHETRKRFGRRLAEDHPAEGDVVVPVPDGGNSAAIGYAEQSGIPLDLGLIRNHYVGRTFIQADQARRNAGVEVKLSPVPDVVRGKRVILVEDSIVRGTTSRAKVAQLRDAGAREIHMRITCPPHRFPCYYGIDFQGKRELVAAQHTVDEIRRFLKLDSLCYLSVESMLSCVKPPSENYCVACFTGQYPVEPAEQVHKHALERV